MGKNIALEIKNVSKQYRLGQVGTRTLQHDLNRWWYRIRGKEDPYLKIGEVNDRSTKGSSEYVWALRDINLEVEQGDILGIIGKNGAGKSTLLKILSRVTKPTTGSISYKGRIASLLEVGTGFNPEMTGRENIYMNGAILGMTRKEITRKLDEIVDFAGVERYLDTPTKRYSSGMTVRLGFAVAAHLDPEILVVDEVLAVGDAEFQKKAIGKMQDVSRGGGRTVLFVSHNMGSMKKLCKNGIYLSDGEVAYAGEINNTIQEYINNTINKSSEVERLYSSCGRFYLETPYFTDSVGKKTTVFSFEEEIELNFPLTFIEEVPFVNPGFAVLNNIDERIFTSHLADDKYFDKNQRLIGNVVYQTKLNLKSLAPGVYKVIYGVRDEKDNTVIFSKENVYFEINQVVKKNGSEGILWHTSLWNIKNSNI